MQFKDCDCCCQVFLSLRPHSTRQYPSRLFSVQLSLFALAAAALVALSASLASATASVKFIIDSDNATPFFIGSDKLVGVSTAMSTAATDNAAISSLLDAALSKKYDNATITAWRRLMGTSSTRVATAGPALSGEIKCFVGANGEVVGLQYGSAVVCKSSSRVVNVKIGTNYVSNIKVGSSFLLFPFLFFLFFGGGEM